MELNRDTYDDGDVVTTNIEIKSSKNKLVVYFIKSAYSDRNKWNERQVLTDVEVTRCQISEIYRNSDPTGSKLIDYIKNNNSKDASITRDLVRLSDKTDVIYIGLPTSTTLFGSARKFKDTFRPLIVKINNEDASRCFQDFDLFGSQAVNVAYDALIKGKNPTSTNNFVSFYEIGFLRNQICRPLNANEEELEE